MKTAASTTPATPPKRRAVKDALRTSRLLTDPKISQNCWIRNDAFYLLSRSCVTLPLASPAATPRPLSRSPA